MNAVSSQLTKDQLRELVDHDKLEGIWDTRKDVISYRHFRNAIDLGMTVGINDLPFEKAMIFSWIKGEIDGRKTRV